MTRRSLLARLAALVPLGMLGGAVKAKAAPVAEPKPFYRLVVEGGRDDDTDAVQEAYDRLVRTGGGQLVLAPGYFHLSRPLRQTVGDRVSIHADCVWFEVRPEASRA